MQKGFTLLEVLMVVGILVLLAGVLFGLEQTLFSQNGSLQARLLADQDARSTLRHLVAEIRAATAADNGAYALVTVASTSLSFYADANADGLHERIRYFVNGATLQKGVIKPTGSPAVYNAANEVITTVVHGLTSVSPTMFSYYDNSYTGTTELLTFPVTATEVRLVKVTLSIDNDPVRPPGPAFYTTAVAIRNLKENL